MINSVLSTYITSFLKCDKFGCFSDFKAAIKFLKFFWGVFTESVLIFPAFYFLFFSGLSIRAFHQLPIA